MKLAHTLVIFTVVELIILGCTVVAIQSSDDPCFRRWPSLELFLTIHLRDGSRRNDEFAKFFLRSYRMFWPLKQSRTKLRLVIDEELKSTRSFKVASHTFNHYAKLIGPELTNISFSAPSPYYNDRGYDRQQLLMFWADNFTDRYEGIERE
jgi:hypothetical protein